MKVFLLLLNMGLMLGAAWRVELPQILTVALLAYALGSSGSPRLAHAAPWVLVAWVLSDLSAMSFDNHLRYRPAAHAQLLLEYGVTAFALKLVTVALALLVVWALLWAIQRLSRTTLGRNLSLLCALLASITALLFLAPALALPAGVLRILVTVLIILVLRLVQYAHTPASPGAFLRQALPPIYDPSPFVRHCDEGPRAGSIDFSSRASLRCLVFFHLLYSGGQLLAEALFHADPELLFPVAAGVLPNLEVIPLPLLTSAARPALWGALFFRGLFFITNVMSISLLAEAAYHFFGRRLRSEFAFDLRAPSFADFFSGIVPMQAQFIKDAFLYPCFEVIGPRKRGTVAVISVIGVFLCGTILNLVKFLDPRQSGDALENLWRFTQVDLVAYGLIGAALVGLRGEWARRALNRVPLNLCYVLLLGVVITIRHRALVVPLGEKLRFFVFLLGGPA